jgi:hypothetical protein
VSNLHGAGQEFTQQLQSVLSGKGALQNERNKSNEGLVPSTYTIYSDPTENTASTLQRWKTHSMESNRK